MDFITSLKIYNREELVQLLRDCAYNLNFAFQELSEKALFLTSREALKACDYLLYEIHKEQSIHTIH